MGLIAGPAMGLLRAVPLWVWLLLGSVAWGGWQRHRATEAAQELAAAQLQAAEQREAALAAAVHEQARVAAEQGAIADDIRRRLDVARAAAGRARAAAERMRDATAAAAANAASAAAAGDCAPAADAARVHTELLGRAVERARVLAEHADAAGAAGQACQRAYDALMPADVTLQGVDWR